MVFIFTLTISVWFQSALFCGKTAVLIWVLFLKIGAKRRFWECFVLITGAESQWAGFPQLLKNTAHELN